MASETKFDFGSFMSAAGSPAVEKVAKSSKFHSTVARQAPVRGGYALTVDDAMKTKLRFGKRHGETLGEVAKTLDGWSYLEYLARWDQLNARTKEAVDLVLTSCPVPTAELDQSMSYALPFGKYKGMTLGDLCRSEKGRDYLEYLNEWNGARAVLKAMVGRVLDAYNEWQAEQNGEA